MAKESVKRTHTHVPTHIGLTVIAVIAILFSAVVVTHYNSSEQTQTYQSHAATKPKPTPAKHCIAWFKANGREYCVKWGY